MCMWGDDDGWRVYREATRRAAKDHRCDECRRVIATGERYMYVTGLSWDGDWWSTFRTCLQCEQAKRWLLKVCHGYMFEMTAEDLANHVIGDESYLRTAALTRLVRWQEQGWRDRDGQIRSVDAVRKVVDRAISRHLIEHPSAVAS